MIHTMVYIVIRNNLDHNLSNILVNLITSMMIDNTYYSKNVNHWITIIIISWIISYTKKINHNKLIYLFFRFKNGILLFNLIIKYIAQTIISIDTIYSKISLCPISYTNIFISAAMIKTINIKLNFFFIFICLYF